jgi:rubrerythrin
MQNIDFAALSLMDALDLATLIEEEAQDRYAEFVAQMEQHRQHEAAAFFRWMIDNEMKHGYELSQRRLALFGQAPSRVDRAMLWEEEAPGYETVSPVMSVREVMDVARQAEIKAQRFFELALPHVVDESVRTLFRELRAEEVEHQRMVEQAMAKLAPEALVSQRELEDEPVAAD